MRHFRKEIIIGKDKGGCSAVNMFLPVTLSENSTCYWIWDSESFLFPIEMYISKESPLGKQIAELVKRFKKPSDACVLAQEKQERSDKFKEEFIDLINEVILAQLSVEDIRNLVENAKEEAYNDGVEKARAQMREALGL